MTVSREVGIAAAFALIALGAVAFALFGTRYAASEAGLEGYLVALQQKQLEHFTKRRVYADTLEELTAIGLASLPDGFTVTKLESSSAAFCWAGKRLGDPVQFTVSPFGVKRSSATVSHCEP